MRNLSYENEYDLHSNGLVSKTHFHMKGFALGLVLKQRQKRTRKWPIMGSFGGTISRAKAPFTRVRTNFCTDEFCTWTACLHGTVQILLQIAVVFTWARANFEIG